MNIRMGGVVCVGMILVGCAWAQSDQDSAWIGVWQARLDGLPSAVLTLAKDNRALEGTLVLNGISRDEGQPHIAVREAHVLMHPRLEGQMLSFQLKRRDPSSLPMNFTANMNAKGKVTLHCMNCGDDAPMVEMTKED
jgi:hypothetical protein